jgi:hypothetical protein
MSIEGGKSFISISIGGVNAIARSKEFDRIVAVGVSPEVITQHSRPCNRVKRWVDHCARDSAANHMVASTVDLGPLHASGPPRRIEVPREGIESFVIVVIAIEWTLAYLC